MLSREDNDLLCRVGPGTPMGALLRQYWIPAVLSSELPEADGPPARVRLLGENLVAFRVTSGAVGLIQNHCPHRGASLFFGRNEAEGIRCVYHGWKFDRGGRCVDMPSEPAESDFHQQDQAVTESMGPIIDRAREHLGSSDAMVIRTRRRVLGAARALRDRGEIPPAVDAPGLYRCRSGGVILPRGADWLEATRDLRQGSVGPPEGDGAARPGAPPRG
jgi:nitrite reductase/ring-hydroxylating ferredoxin subunit